jgi:hypothetical protein
MVYEVPADSSEETKPGFSRVPPPGRRPGFDPSNSPLSRGGLPDSAAPTPADAALRGLLADPLVIARPRVMLRVRRVGWVARRSQARSRFASLADKKGSSASSRVLEGLRSRGGVLERSKRAAVRPRFNLRRT